MNGNGSNDMFPQGFIDMMNADAAAEAAAVRADCTHCQEWEICPFHPAPVAVAPTPKARAEAKALGLHLGRPGPVAVPSPAPPPIIAGARLLGLDDPEVSTDLIYAVPGGGVMGVPQASNTVIGVDYGSDAGSSVMTVWRREPSGALTLLHMSEVSR